MVLVFQWPPVPSWRHLVDDWTLGMSYVNSSQGVVEDAVNLIWAGNQGGNEIGIGDEDNDSCELELRLK